MKQLGSVGTYGATVAILRRAPGAPFQLRWRDPQTRKYCYQTVPYRVLSKAKDAALAKAHELAQQRAPQTTTGAVTWGRLLAWFEREWVPLAASANQRDQDRRCLAIWRAVLPLDEPVEAAAGALFERFKQARKAGTVVVPGIQLKAGCSDRTVGADLEWLRRVVNLGRKAPGWTLRDNPVTKVAIPDTPQPKRPIASIRRYTALRAHADGVGSQGLFGGFLDLLYALGWRVSAICQLELTDIDCQGSRWRIRKRGDVDKEGVDAWVPVSDYLQPQLQALLARRGTTGRWLFPQPTNPLKPWTRCYAKDRLRAAERRAGLPPLDGGDFHPYRRLWATQRKHLPVTDVAYAGGWRSVATLQRHYQLVDEDTVLAVMNATPSATP